MSRRVRKPTARALDAAQSRLLEQAVQEERKRPSTTSGPSHSAHSAAVKRKGRAVNAKGRDAVARDQARASAQVTEEEQGQGSEGSTEPHEDAEQPDLTLYCVCLGYDTGEEPMIQCSHCTNWFHFGCIGLSEGIATQIESFACEMCQQMGVGSTKMLATSTSKPPRASTSKEGDSHPEANPDDEEADGDAQSNDEPDSGIDDENEEDEMGADEDGDYGAEEGSAKKRRRGKQSTARAGRAARRRKLEVEEDAGSDSFDEDQDDDTDDDEGEEKPKSKGKKKPTPNRRPSGSTARPVVTPADSKGASSVPQTEKTRTAVVKQFTATFSSIYSASSNADAEDVSHRATSFAQAVEDELFAGFYEVDDKGIRAPRARYTSKFRSLQFNLKTNAVFRSRIAHDEFDPAGIVNISAEDLQTPELKAMAESVRAASLKNSVKEALVAPTAKRTHKGEEEMENNSARLAAEEEAAFKEMERKKSAEQSQRERSNSINQAESPFPDDSKYGQSNLNGSPSPATPDPSGDASSDPFSRPRHRPSLTGSSSQNMISSVDHESGIDSRSPSMKQGSPFSPADSPFSSSHREGRSRSPAVVKSEEGEGAMSPPPQPRQRNSSTSIDMSAIWGKAKAASPSVEPESAGGDGDPAMGGGEEPDMFNFDSTKDDMDDDDFEKGLFRSESASPVKKDLQPPAQTKPQIPAISELAPIWAGDLIVTEEGGFPAFGVQVGGRPVGIDSKTWQKLVPRGLTTAGRISTHQASKYLVDCCFAPTRELNIVALLPDTTGPSELFPHKPTGDRCLAKHAHILSYYLNKDRIGVVQAPKEMSGLVKDIYIIPLPKEQPLPEYVELLDEHFIPETGKRDQDLLLCVLVVQKGVLPTVRSKPLAPSPAPVPTPASAPVSTPAGTAASPQHSSGSSLPSDATSFLSNVDPTTLQSLLSNPQTLSALTTSESQSILNVANSQQSLPLSVPTGPRSSSLGTSGPPIHPSRLAQLGGMAGDPNSYGAYVPPPPTGPQRTISSGGGPTGPSLGGYNSQGQHFEHNLLNQAEYNHSNPGGGIGDGGWANSIHGHSPSPRGGGRGGHRDFRGGHRGRGGHYGRGRGGNPY